MANQFATDVKSEKSIVYCTFNDDFGYSPHVIDTIITTVHMNYASLNTILC